MPRSSPSSGAERPGAALTLLSAAAVAAVLAGNLAPPRPIWCLGLLPLAAATAWLAVRRHPGGQAWWMAAGLLAGLAACGLAPRAPDGVDAPAPVRFEATVRDGWVESRQGWRTRLHLVSATQAGRPVGTPSEVRVFVGGSATLADLPPPGGGIAGSGALAWDPAWPLEAPTLRVKSTLLLSDRLGGWSVDRVRQAAVAALQRAAGVDPARIRAAGLAAALALGRTEGLPAGEVNDWKRAGLVHILAVSGMNVGMVAAMAWGLLALAGVAPRSRRWALIPVVLAFCAVAGGDAPVRRAAFGATAYLLARQLGRPLAPLPTVWAIVAGLALAEPRAALSASFQLSAGITLALVRWVEPLSRWLGALGRRPAQEIAVVVVAQLASFPLVGTLFGSVPPWGLLANLAAAPASFALMAVALAAVLLATASAPLGAPVLGVLAVLQRLLDGLAALAGTAAWSFPPPAAWCLFLLVPAGLLAVTHLRASRVAAAAVVGGAALWMLPVAAGHAPFEVRMLPVREGMALLVRSPEGSVLVDTGKAPCEAALALGRLGVRRLDALVLTHPDDDHIGGASCVLDRARVELLAYPAAMASAAEAAPLRRLARKLGVPERSLMPGPPFELAGMRWKVLSPGPGARGSDNNASLVALVTLGGERLLITGDIEADGERLLLATAGDLRADVLQLGHHGSATSSTPGFLAAVSPVVALAPTGTKPRFSYPHPSVAARVRALPAVLALQGQGLDAVGWQGDGSRLAVGPVPVLVRAHRGGGHG